MGLNLIILKCIATDPGQTTVYGFGYGRSSEKAERLDTMILIKSQANPSTIADIKWSAVSTFTRYRNSHEMITHKSPVFTCAVNSAGVFNVISYDFVNPTPDGNDLLGIRYDPAGTIASSQMDASESMTGGGKWEEINLDAGFNATESLPYDQQILFYVREANRDKETLIHAYSGGDDPAVYLNTVDESSQSLRLKPLATYKNDVLKVTSARTIAYGNGQLYVYNASTNASVIAISLANMHNSTAKPTIKRFDIESAFQCGRHEDDYRMWTWKDSYFLFCKRGDQTNVDFQEKAQLLTIASPLTENKTTTIRLYPTSDAIVLGFRSIYQSVGGHLPGQEAFALIPYTGAITGVTLTGLSAGEPQKFTDATVEGVYGNGPAEAVSSLSSLSGAQRGAIISVAMFVVLIVGLLVLRRVRQRRAKRNPSADVLREGDSKVEQERNDAAIELGHVVPATTVSAASEDSTATLGVQDHNTPPPYAGLSRHPQPTVTTTLGNN